ncbi:MAG: DNA polymerase III subunit beta [Eubacteriales bacterium]|nr:DNA polymerase III subunit beta [Eubacteriales bacterium]
MKILFEKDQLIKSINISLKAIATRTTDELSNCIHIRAAENVYFTTNDSEMWIKTMVPAVIEETGAVAVNARLFSDIIKKLPAQSVHLTIEGTEARITSGQAKFKIPCLSLDGVDDVPEINRDYTMQINGFSLREMVRKTIFCAAQGESGNYTMLGEKIEIDKDVLRITALDGCRIGVYNVTLDKEYPANSCIVPAKTLQEISRIIRGETDELVEIVITDKHILFILEETVLLSRLISGSFFQFERLVSDDYELKVRVNKNEITESVDRSLLLSRESDTQPLVLRIGEEMRLSIRSKLGRMNESLTIEKEQDVDTVFGVNPRYVIEALKAIDDEEINMYFISNNAPMLIRDDAKTYVYILLPVSFVDEGE